MASKEVTHIPSVILWFFQRVKTIGLKYQVFSFTAVALFFLSAAQYQSGSEPIVLEAEKLSFKPAAYFIADVVDAREDKKAVAWLLPLAASPDPSATALPVDLEGGTAPAIREFIWQSLPQDKKLHPLVIQLKECRIEEEAGEGERVTGRIAVAMAFSLRRDGELLPLTEYEGGVRYSRAASQQTVVAPALRKSLVSALQYLDNWMNEHAGESPLLAREVKVSFSDYTTNQSEDTVFYSPDRPLEWDDFRGKPRPGPFAAAIMPTFAYGGPTEVKEGVIHLNLQLKVFALRENCWVRPHVKDNYSLNHEQRHLELVRLVGERFKQKILAKKLSVEDYAGVIAYEYIESFREMNRLQEQYDGETSHGTNHLAQERWNRHVDEELRAIGLK